MFKAKSLKEQIDALCAYLPDGRLSAAKYKEGSVLRNLLSAIAISFYRLEKAMEDVMVNMNPKYAETLIDEWEKALGIPDDIFPKSTDLETRRSYIIIKLRSLGIQTADDFKTLAELFGYTVDVDPGAYWGCFPMSFPIMFAPSTRGVKNVIVITYRNQDDPYTFPLQFPINFSTQEKFDIIKKLFEKVKPANVLIIYRYRPD